MFDGVYSFSRSVWRLVLLVCTGNYTRTLHHWSSFCQHLWFVMLQAQEMSLNGMVSLSLRVFCLWQSSSLDKGNPTTKTKGKHFRSLLCLHLRSVGRQVSPSHLRFMRPIRLARALRGVRVMRLFRYVGALRTLLLQLGRHWNTWDADVLMSVHVLPILLFVAAAGSLRLLCFQLVCAMIVGGPSWAV